MSYQDVKNSRQRLKERLVYIMGEKCSICGYNRDITALEFHHINPEEKEFSLGTNSNIGTEKAINEIKKCTLVCANCHREIHSGLIDNSILKSTFNEEKANEVLQLVKDLKTHKVYYCSHCGKELYEKTLTGLCQSCYGKSTRKVERPSREELKNMIRTIPFTTIAKDYGVSDKAITKWCIAEGLPSRKKDINTYSDEEWEKI